MLLKVIRYPNPICWTPILSAIVLAALTETPSDQSASSEVGGGFAFRQAPHNLEIVSCLACVRAKGLPGGNALNIIKKYTEYIQAHIENTYRLREKAKIEQTKQTKTPKNPKSSPKVTQKIT